MCASSLLISRLPDKFGRQLRFITLILATVFTLPLIKACYDLISDSLLFESRSGSWLRTPLAYPQTILLIGAIMLFLQLVAEIIKTIIAMDKSRRRTDGFRDSHCDVADCRSTIFLLLGLEIGWAIGLSRLLG